MRRAPAGVGPADHRRRPPRRRGGGRPGHARGPRRRRRRGRRAPAAATLARPGHLRRPGRRPAAGPARWWPRSTTSGPSSVLSGPAATCWCPAARPWPSARTRPRCNRPSPADLVEACLAHDEDRAAGAGRRGRLHGDLPGLQAGRGPLGAPERHRGGVGRGRAAAQRHRAGDDRHAHGGRHAGRPRDRPLLDLLPIPVGRPGRPEEIAALVRSCSGPTAASSAARSSSATGAATPSCARRDWPAAWDISGAGPRTRLTLRSS